MRDMTARRRARTALVLSLLALVTALGAYSVQAYAFAPDDAVTVEKLQQQVDALTDQVNDQDVRLAEHADAINTLYANDGVLDERTAITDCLAFSDYHYVRERINGGKKRWRMPLVVWRMDVPTCRADPKKQWRPSRRVNPTLTLEVPRAR